MNESQLSAKLVKELNSSILGGVFFKVHQGVHSARLGISDILGCVNGRFVAIECKVIDPPNRATTPLKIKLTSLQKHFLYEVNRVKGHGAVAIYVKPEHKWYMLDPLLASQNITKKEMQDLSLELWQWIDMWEL